MNVPSPTIKNPHGWHEMDLTLCTTGGSGQAGYQSFGDMGMQSFPQDAMRHGPSYQSPFLYSLPSRDQDIEVQYRQRSSPDIPSPYSTDILSHSGSPLSMSDRNEVKFPGTTPTFAPSNNALAFNSTSYPSSKSTESYPFPTEQIDRYGTESHGQVGPNPHIAWLPISNPQYITPTMQDESDRLDSFSMTRSQHPQQQRQHEEVELPRPMSRKASPETLLSSSDEEMITDQSKVAPRIRTRPQSSSRSTNESTSRPSRPSLSRSRTTRSRGREAITSGITPSKSAERVTRTSPIVAARSRDIKDLDEDKEARSNASRLRARQAHSLVEKRYRENLNMRITQLSDTLQRTRYGPPQSQSQSQSPPSSTARNSPLSHPVDTHQRQQHPQIPTPISPTYSSFILPSQPLITSPSSAPAAPQSDPFHPSPSAATTNTTTTPPPDKKRKSDILVSAMSYIDHAEIRMHMMNQQIHRLNAHIRFLEQRGTPAK